MSLLANHGMIRPLFAYDPDAQAFFTQVEVVEGISLGTTIKGSVNDLVLALKAASFWSKFNVIYISVGSDWASAKYNLKDPRDLDAAFRQVRASGAVDPSVDGVGQYTSPSTEMYLNPSTVLTTNNTHIAIYITEVTVSTALDAYASDGTNFFGIAAKSGSNMHSDQYNNNDSQGRAQASSSTGLGFTLGSRTASNNHFIQRNGVTQVTDTTSGGSLPNANMIIGGVRTGSSGAGGSASLVRFGWFSVGQSFTTTEGSDLEDIVQAFQTALSRNAY